MASGFVVPEASVAGVDAAPSGDPGVDGAEAAGAGVTTCEPSGGFASCPSSAPPHPASSSAAATAIGVIARRRPPASQRGSGVRCVRASSIVGAPEAVVMAAA